MFRDTFWMPDEAASVYAQASAVIGFECHSPIIALVQGTPAFYIRQPTDTCKGQMYPDLGAGAWQFEADKINANELWRVLQDILANPVATRVKALSVMNTVHAKQAVMGKALQSALLAMDTSTPKHS